MAYLYIRVRVSLLKMCTEHPEHQEHGEQISKENHLERMQRAEKFNDLKTCLRFDSRRHLCRRSTRTVRDWGMLEALNSNAIFYFHASSRLRMQFEKNRMHPIACIFELAFFF